MRAVANETEREFSALSCQSSLSHRQYVVLPVTWELVSGMQWRYLARVAVAGACMCSYNDYDLPCLDASARYVSPELQLQVQLCQQSHHSTLHSQVYVTARE